MNSGWLELLSGDLIRMTSLESYKRVSDKQQMSIFRLSSVLASAICCTSGRSVRTLNAAICRSCLGARKFGILYGCKWMDETELDVERAGRGKRGGVKGTKTRRWFVENF